MKATCAEDVKGSTNLSPGELGKLYILPPFITYSCWFCLTLASNGCFS